MGKTDIFQTGNNCWRVARADHVSIVVDYGNYYRDLRESLLKARRSVFVLGWDIDSRIELLRGRDAEGEEAVTFYDVIVKIARERPELQIYLNKWDYSAFFMQQREPFWMRRWRKAGLPNIHLCLDDRLPLGACHHQKIVVIDDEIAYWGGMDVALGRWDFRHHHVRNDRRADPPQLLHGDEKEHFGPYHDIQAVLSGPAARALAQWARERWRAAAPEAPVPLDGCAPSGVPAAWPDSDPPDFCGIDVAIARTIPALGRQDQVEEVLQLLLCEIAQAESFIYIENQFLTSPDIARAINKRLHERPSLRVLLVSCRQPQGIMERKAMWGGRLRFRRLLESGGVAARVGLACPVSCEAEGQADVRIHSKLMIVDDRFLHIGSANLNNRSMGMDTECDITLDAQAPAHRRKVADVRNDLIREHTGLEAADIERVIAQGAPVGRLLERRESSRQHLLPLDDSRYAKERGVGLAIRLADPRRPPIAAALTRLPGGLRVRGWKGRRIMAASAAAVAALCLLPLAWTASGLGEWVDPDRIATFLDQVTGSPWALAWVVAAYVVGGLVFFPVTVLSAAVILAFPGILGLAYSLAGALASALAGYLIGRALGRDRLERALPSSRAALGKVRAGGVIGVTVIRTLPVAPYSLMNLLFGVIRMPLAVFMAGTFLGLLPGKAMMALFGTTLKETLKDPHPAAIAKAAAFFACWLAVIALCHGLAKKWQARHGTEEEGATPLQRAA